MMEPRLKFKKIGRSTDGMVTNIQRSLPHRTKKQKNNE